jgi:hypothetical protein
LLALVAGDAVPPAPMELFDDAEDAEPEVRAGQGGGAGEEDATLRVNQSYANRFEQRKKKQVRAPAAPPASCVGLLSAARALRWRCITCGAMGG